MMNEKRYMMVVARSAAPVVPNRRVDLHRVVDERDRLRAQCESLRLQVKAMAADNARIAGELYVLRKGGANHG